MGVRMDAGITGLLLVGAVIFGIAVVMDGLWPLDDGE